MTGMQQLKEGYFSKLITSATASAHDGESGLVPCLWESLVMSYGRSDDLSQSVVDNKGVDNQLSTARGLCSEDMYENMDLEMLLRETGQD